MSASEARPAAGGSEPEKLKKKPGLLRRIWRWLPWKIRLALALPAMTCAGGAIGLAGLFVYYTLTFPDPLTLRQNERAPVIRILARDGSLLAERGQAYDYTPLDLLPRHVVDAVVSTEDRRFFEHWGLDPTGLLRAAFANLRAGRYSQGGSTLTQQLAKNLFLRPERTLGRKVEELALALWLEMRLSKADILEIYLNRVYFGAGAYGLEAASRRYFGKSARQLTVAEGAVLAGLLKAPSKYSPVSSPGAARARGRVVLKSMLAAGALSEAQERAAARQPVRFVAVQPGREFTGVEYAVDFALERLPGISGSGHGEVIVETTIDAGLQKRAQAIVQRTLETEGPAAQASQAAAIVLDPEGGIEVLIGGKSYVESQFNRAVKARRQPGSAFKPFVYLAAIESGFTPATVSYDLPLTIEGWSPRNENGLHRGPVQLRDALAQSINTVAVRLLLDVGASRVANVGRRLGIRSELRPQPALALGASEVTLAELTAAYVPFSSGGVLAEPHIVRRVRMSTGRVLYERPAASRAQVVTPAGIAAMNDMLSAVMQTGTGRRAALATHPAGGKTGTSQDFRDAWFIGYTAHRTAGVWVGNDGGVAMNRVTGGGLPARIWRQIMTLAHEGRAPLPLPGLEQRPVAAFTVAPSVRSVPFERHPAPRRAPAPPVPSADAPRLPQQRIDADFVDRALSGG